jgi:hypothetical protein
LWLQPNPFLYNILTITVRRRQLSDKDNVIANAKIVKGDQTFRLQAICCQ